MHILFVTEHKKLALQLLTMPQKFGGPQSNWWKVLDKDVDQN